MPVLEGALVDVERLDGRVVERAAVGDQPDVFEAHQQRERLVERHEAQLPADRRQRDVPHDGEPAGAVDPGGMEEMLRDRADRAREDDHAEGRADEAVGEHDDQHRHVALHVDRRQAESQ